MPHCPNDGSPVARQTPQQIVDRVLELEEGTRFQVLAPVVRGRKGEYETLLKELAREGFSRARIDGEIRDLTEEIKLDRYFQHTIEVVVDRLVRKEGIERRLTDSLETALRLAEGVAVVDIIDGPTLTFSQHFACAECGLSFEELQPRNFSFNSPYGACPECSGIGTRFQVDPELIVPQPDRTLEEERCAVGWPAPDAVLQAGARSRGGGRRHRHEPAIRAALQEARQLLLYGAGDQPFDVSYQNRFGRRRRYETTYEGASLGWSDVTATRTATEPATSTGSSCGRCPCVSLRRRAAQPGLAGGHGRRPQRARALDHVAAAGLGVCSAPWS